jgi:hypothetical protein
MTSRWSCSYALLACLAWGCGEKEDPSAVDAGHVHDAGHVDEEDEVPCPASIPAFEPGFTTEGKDGLISVRLVSAEPNTPQKGDNDWVVEFVDAAGNVIEDIKVSRVQPWMEVHNHPGNYDAQIVPLSEPGRVSFERVNLKMTGPWIVRVSASSARVGSDFMEMHACVPRK